MTSGKGLRLHCLLQLQVLGFCLRYVRTLYGRRLGRFEDGE